MAGISFSVFKDKIKSGSKRQTIRRIRKHPIKEGEKLYLWWKQRTSDREHLGNAICTLVLPVTIKHNGFSIEDNRLFSDRWNLTNDEFAIADGFEDWTQLVEFFENAHGLPYEGVLIQWGDLL